MEGLNLLRNEHVVSSVYLEETTSSRINALFYLW